MMQETSSSFFFFKKKKKALYEVKTIDLQLSFNIIRQPSTWHKIKKTKLQTIDPEFNSILIQFNFDMLEKGLEIVSPPNFVYDFSRIFLSNFFHVIFY